MGATHPAFLRDGGEAGEAIRHFDWAQSPLGPVEAWPEALNIAVGLMLGSHFPKAIVWGPALTTLHNDAFKPLLGDKPAAIGRSFREIWQEAWPTIGPIADKAFAGEATFIENFPLVINRRGHDEEAFFTFCYSPIRDGEGVVRGFMDTVIETTETVRAQRDEVAINAELHHRMRNLVAVVSTLARQTFKTVPGIGDRLEVFEGRLETLGKAQELLLSELHPDATIRQLVTNMVVDRLGAAERVHAAGPEIHMQGRKALSLALALNELMTNSIKYGALSTEDGVIDISWGRDAEAFSFVWREAGGPPVTPPAQTGFGRRLIEDNVAAHFSGTAQIEYHPDGLRYTITTNPSVLDS
ncbi:sensor histidine kinase [Pseudohoeflea coraliihabitans]|uniref:histidine kinase n=1 Tax=Pseudohoeflea coraliihabitans TaxID=2860393 RepID=A0ABS6WKF6_9HYPH|nr:PAS domain-containing sensor histidine kinase [Pseudohoeflea sp. DP4N28-3]MBW3096138.1 sensor histidine kinase [Pseudohoeflea sp. DP4N28-3]